MPRVTGLYDEVCCNRRAVLHDLRITLGAASGPGARRVSRRPVMSRSWGPGGACKRPGVALAGSGPGAARRKGESMSNRILVVCYSRGGATYEVARHIASSLGAELERIEDATPRRGVGGYLRSALEALTKGLPTIRAHHDPRDYDFVVIGTPVWAGTLASPIRAYLAAHHGALRVAGCFAVMGGVGGDQAVQELKAACGADEAPSCVLTDRDVRQDRYKSRCTEFISAIQAQTGTAEHRRSAAA